MLKKWIEWLLFNLAVHSGKLCTYILFSRGWKFKKHLRSLKKTVDNFKKSFWSCNIRFWDHLLYIIRAEKHHLHEGSLTSPSYYSKSRHMSNSVALPFKCFINFLCLSGIDCDAFISCWLNKKGNAFWLQCKKECGRERH